MISPIQTYISRVLVDSFYVDYFVGGAINNEGFNLRKWHANSCEAVMFSGDDSELIVSLNVKILGIQREMRLDDVI